MGFRVAIASTDNIVVNQHFGHTERFYIYDVYGETNKNLVEERRVHPPCSFEEFPKSIKNLVDLGSLRYTLMNNLLK